MLVTRYIELQLKNLMRHGQEYDVDDKRGQFRVVPPPPVV